MIHRLLIACTLAALALMPRAATAQAPDLIVSGPGGEMGRILREAVFGPFQQRTGLYVLYRPNWPVSQSDIWIAEAEAVQYACERQELLGISWPILDRLRHGGLQLVDGARTRCGAGVLIDANALAYRTAPALAPNVPSLSGSGNLPVDLPAPSPLPSPSPQQAEPEEPIAAPSDWSDFFDLNREAKRVVTRDMRSVFEAADGMKLDPLTVFHALQDKQQLLVVETHLEQLDRLEDGRANMAIAPVSMIQAAAQDRMSDLAIADKTMRPFMLMFAVPDDALQRQANATRLIGFALQPETQAEIARLSWFGLTNLEAASEMTPMTATRRANKVPRWTSGKRRDSTLWARHPAAATGWQWDKSEIEHKHGEDHSLPPTTAE
ncbi:MAG: hypothetical protein Alpg2KO_13800 [Alphaproteobacteria bacterium]